MIDHILNHLRLADFFDKNAQRIKALAQKPVRWRFVVLQCKRDAARKLAEARALALSHGLDFDRLVWEHEAERRIENLIISNIDDLTVSDLLWCVAAARTSPRGSRRLQRALERENRVINGLKARADFAEVNRLLVSANTASPANCASSHSNLSGSDGDLR